MVRLFYELRTITDSQIALKLNSRFRYVFVLLLAIVGAGIGYSGGVTGGITLVLPIILSLFFLLVILYEESWYFDNEREEIVHLHGLLVAKKRYYFPVQEISHMELTSFRKGRVSEKEEKKRFFQKDFIRLALVMKEGERKDIQITESKHRQELERKARKAASFVGLVYKSE